MKGNEYAEQLAFEMRKCLLMVDPSNDDFYKEQREIVEFELESIKDNSEIANSLKTIFILWAYRRRKTKSVLDMYFEKAKALDKESMPLDKISFNKLYKELKQHAKCLRKAEKESGRTSLRLKISLDDVKALLWLFSILFLCTGVIYNQLYLRYFGIEVSKFFSVNDYINTSVDKIFFTLIPIIAGILYILIFPPPRHPPIPGKLSYIIGVLALFSFALYFCFVVYLFYIDNPFKYSAISFFIGFAFVILLRKLTKIYFNMPDYIYLFILVAGIFLSNIITSTMEERENVLKRDPNKLKKYNIKFNKIENVDANNLFFLTANSSYYLFYDRQLKKAIIIPNRNVIYIDTVK